MPRAVSADALPQPKFLPQPPFSLTPEQLPAPDRILVTASTETPLTVRYVVLDIALKGADRVGCDRSYKGLARTESTARRIIGLLQLGVLNKIGHRSQFWVIRSLTPPRGGLYRITCYR